LRAARGSQGQSCFVVARSPDVSGRRSKPVERQEIAAPRLHRGSQGQSAVGFAPRPPEGRGCVAGGRRDCFGADTPRKDMGRECPGGYGVCGRRKSTARSARITSGGHRGRRQAISRWAIHVSAAIGLAAGESSDAAGTERVI